MKIYTKTGDQGTSGLFGGQRVPKTHPRLEAYGTMDELNSVLGMLGAHIQDSAVIAELNSIQSALFSIGTILASPRSTDTIPPSLIQQLESSIDDMTKQLPDLRNFILPGGCVAAATAHVARTVCRRAEQRIVTLSETEAVAAEIMQYINRLSDWLFTLARYLNKQQGISEQPWHSQ